MGRASRRPFNPETVLPTQLKVGSGVITLVSEFTPFAIEPNLNTASY